MERAVDKPKVLFSYINSRLKNKETVAVLKGENNEDIIENDAKAENLSRFFVSVFTDETDFDEAGSPAGTTDEVIENMDFTEEDVRKELLALKEGKSPGPDQIPAKVLKELSCELAKPLWHIFRSSFDRGILPSDWKVANIYPIHKGGSRTSTNNYRPAFHAAADSSFKYQLVAGNFNLPEVRWSPPSGARMFDDLLEAVDVGIWTQAVNFPTRGSNMLDLIF
nr:unnamed protein product [Spirometra erinaceieuropaei]